jgi:GAF domain-containing protein
VTLELFDEADAARDRLAGRLAAGLNRLVDVDLLLKKLLIHARSLVKAEAGTVYLVRRGRLVFAISQNDYLEKAVGIGQDLPFLGENLRIDRGTLAGFVAIEQRPLTVNDTDRIDPDSPFQHYKRLDHVNSYVCRAIATLPLKASGGETLGVLQLINPQTVSGLSTEFSPGGERALAFFADSAALALEKALMLRKTTLLTIRAVTASDPTETAAHAQRVARLSAEIYDHWANGRKTPVVERERVLNLLPVAAMMHDIGKCFISREVLGKPGRLNLIERKAMEGHVAVGAAMFSIPRTYLDRLALNVILDHHERWDGLGYPGRLGLSDYDASGRAKGKKGEEISIFGRILAVADVYDALSSRRIYKEAFDESLAVQIMEQESGHHFDPEVIESFMAVRQVLGKIRQRFPETGANEDDEPSPGELGQDYDWRDRGPTQPPDLEAPAEDEP